MLIALVIGEVTNNSLKHGAFARTARFRFPRPWMTAGLRCSGVSRCRMHRRSLKPREEGSGYSMMARMARSQRATFDYRIANGELTVSRGLARRASY